VIASVGISGIRRATFAGSTNNSTGSAKTRDRSRYYTVVVQVDEGCSSIDFAMNANNGWKNETF
jgi:hypothetical protein